MSRRDAIALLLYATLAIATGFADLRMRPHTDKVIEDYIPGVVANTEFAPGAYRVLAPLLIQQAADATGLSLETTWYVTRLLFIFAAFCSVHVYLRTWFDPGEAMAGVALTAATLPLTFTNSWPHPDSMPELALFTLAAMAIARRLDLLFALLLALAALNRETSVFLVLLFAVVRPWTRSHLMRALLFGLEWFAIYAGLRLARGVRHYDYWQAARNWADLGLLPDNYDPYYRAYAWFAVALFGPLLYLALRAIRRGATPLFVRRALLVVPCFAVVAFVFSSIIETRIFTPLYTLILPGALCAFWRPRVAPERAAAEAIDSGQTSP